MKIKKRVFIPIVIIIVLGILSIVFVLTSPNFAKSFLDLSPIFSSLPFHASCFITILTLCIIDLVLLIYYITGRNQKTEQLENEKQYREAIIFDAFGAYKVNLSKDVIENIIVDTESSQTTNYFGSLGIKVPCSYTAFLKKTLECVDDNYKSQFAEISSSLLINDFKENRKSRTLEIWMTSASSKNHIYLRIIALLTQDVKTKDYYALIINKDLTKQKEIEEQKDREIYTATFIDPITGGWNRKFFDLQAMRLIRSNPAGTFSFITLDIAGFAIINDIYGLDIGNKILKRLSEVIERHNINCEEISCRHANDIFNILVKTCDKELIETNLIEIADETSQIEELQKTQGKDGEPAHINLKVGIYQIDDLIEPLFTIRDKANVAKKRKSTNKFLRHVTIGYYTGNELIQIEKEDEIARKMEGALKNGEFEAWLQPKLDLRTKKISGAEALVRWNDKTKGLIPPNDFIPVMERNGFVTCIDFAIFEQVCNFLKKIIDAGFEPIRISSNFSRLHLHNEHFIDQLVEITQKYDVPTKYLELEITETAIFDDMAIVSSTTQKAHEAGFLCSIDDFGSGYSSLNMLVDLPFDIIKMDKSFFGNVNDLTNNRKYVIKSMVELGQSLGMHMIIEGVETEDQLHFLCDIGCDNAQGYLLSKPIRMKEFFEKYIQVEYKWVD